MKLGKLLLLALAGLATRTSGDEECPDYCCIGSVCCGPGTAWTGSSCGAGGIGLDEPTPTDICVAVECVEVGCCGAGSALAADGSRGSTRTGEPACMCVGTVGTEPPSSPPGAEPTDPPGGAPTDPPEEEPSLSPVIVTTSPPTPFNGTVEPTPGGTPPTISDAPTPHPTISEAPTPGGTPPVTESTPFPSISHHPTPGGSYSDQPSISNNPSDAPSDAPSDSPSDNPSDAPSDSPSDEPSLSSNPSDTPSDSPSDEPSLSSNPSDAPSDSPSDNPSESPSIPPSRPPYPYPTTPYPTTPYPSTPYPSTFPFPTPTIPTPQPTPDTCYYRRKNITEFNSTQQVELAGLMDEYNTAEIIEEYYTSGLVHHNPRFLPWHRGYIEGLEYYIWTQNKTEYLPLPKWDPHSHTIPLPFYQIDPSCSNVTATSCGTLPINPPIGLPPMNESLWYDNHCEIFYADVIDMQKDLEVWHDYIQSEVDGAFGDLWQSTHLLLFQLWHGWVDDIYFCFEQCGDVSQVTPEPFFPPPDTVIPVPPLYETDATACLEEVIRQTLEEIPNFRVGPGMQAPHVDGSDVLASATQALDHWTSVATPGPVEIQAAIDALDDAEARVAAKIPQSPAMQWYLDTFQRLTTTCTDLMLA